MKAAPLRDRLDARLVPCPDPGCGCECLRWPLSKCAKGYGRMAVGSRTDGSWRLRQVHVVAWELENGPVPDSLMLDHVRARGCVHKDCANIAHLEPVTSRENTLRGDTLAARNAVKTHCPYGHPYDEVNTYVGTYGKRYCRTCARNHHSRRRARIKAEATGPSA